MSGRPVRENIGVSTDDERRILESPEARFWWWAMKNGTLCAVLDISEAATVVVDLGELERCYKEGGYPKSWYFSRYAEKELAKLRRACYNQM